MSLLVFVTLFTTVGAVNAQFTPTYSFVVGAAGDSASVGNIGVSAAIRTHTYQVESTSNSFWVGDNLENGGFIQFGFMIQTPKNYCLKGMVSGEQSNCTGRVEQVDDGDARWFWQYWPNGTGNTFYYSIGPSGSAGANSTWHTYAIEPNPANGWQFVLDNLTIDSVSFQSVQSRNPVYVIAEETTNLPLPSGELGPVEFQNLTYLKSDGWHLVSSLRAVSECGGTKPNCGVTIPYGVSVVGPNDIVAGAGMEPRQSGELLWAIHFNLIVIVPSFTQVKIDGKGYGLGTVQLSLPQGSHSLYVPDMIQIDNSSRVQFSQWDDGVREYNRTIELTSDLTLNASYITQFRLTTDSAFATEGDWYNKGSIANFSVPTSEPMLPSLGLLGGTWNFQGWFESGRLLTTSPTGSIVMQTPHILDARWVPDYTIPLTVVFTFFLASTLLFVYSIKRRRSAVALRQSS